ncbi:hypothetical protein GINT2_000758 [Glugoides intestinalis]
MFYYKSVTKLETNDKHLMKEIDNEISKILDNSQERAFKDKEIKPLFNSDIKLIKEKGKMQIFNRFNDEDASDVNSEAFYTKQLSNIYSGDINARKPFLTSFESPPGQEDFGTQKKNNIELIDLKELLGLSEKDQGCIVIDTEREGLTKEELSSRKKMQPKDASIQKVEEMNQFIDDLFSSTSAGKKLQQQHFNESLFGMKKILKESPNAGLNGTFGNTPYNTTQDHGETTKYDYLSSETDITNVSMLDAIGHSGNASEELLFRNPIMRQNSFNSQNYFKMKKRRRLYSNTWCSSTSMLTFHPSKLSSFEFVHGGPQSTPKTVGNTENFVFSPRQIPENGRIIESFRKQVNRIDFDNVTVHELKSMMKNYGLNPNGKKKDMIDRIKNTMNDLIGRYKEEQLEKTIPYKGDASHEKFFF